MARRLQRLRHHEGPPRNHSGKLLETLHFYYFKTGACDVTSENLLPAVFETFFEREFEVSG